MSSSKISFYFDEMMLSAAAKGLIARGYNVVMAGAIGMINKDDLTEHLPLATEQNRVVVTCDKPFANLAYEYSDHAGLICWTGEPNDIGGMVKALSEFAETHDPEAMRGQVRWLKPP